MTIRAVLIAVPSMFLGWLAVLVLVGLFTDAAPASVVLFPSDAFRENLPEGAAVLNAPRYALTLTSETSGFARSLYRSGALIVLPAGLVGCLPLPRR